MIDPSDEPSLVAPTATMELPRGWVWTNLRTIADIKGGITKGQKRAPGDSLRLVPYLRVANVQRGFLDLTEVKEIDATPNEVEALRLVRGDVLFNEGGDRDKLGRGWIWEEQLPVCIHQNHVFRARVLGSVVHPKLLSWYGNTLGQKYFVDEGKQTTNLASINITKLGALPVPLPPLAEQHRIVAAVEQHISDIDAGAAGVERALANLKRYRASVLKAACEGRLVPTEAELAPKEGRDYEPADALLRRILKERRARWEADQLAKMKAKGQTPKDDNWKAKYEEPELPSTTGLPDLPTGWCWAAVSQLARRVTVGHVGPMKHRYAQAGIPFLRSQNVRENRFDPEGLLFIPHEFHEELSKSKLKAGDIVVVRSGSVGTACVIPDTIPEANCSDLVIIQEPAGLVAAYGAYVLNSVARRHIEAGKVGIALTHFNTKSVAELPIPLPPLAEQLRIVAEVDRLLSTADETEQALRAQLARAARLRQAVLKRAFEGKLVPQDPTDEPASTLLARLRSQRPEGPKRTPRPRARSPQRTD